METPAGDPGFLNSPQHGLEAQLATMRLVLSHVRGRRRAVDVGAHIGTWTSGLLDEFAYVWAFEPQEENFRCLAINARRAVTERVALGDSWGGIAMMKHGSNSGCYAIDTNSIQTATMRPLDSYCLDDVDFIKLDVEGYEGRVLRGAVNTIEHSRPAVFFEDNGLGEKLYGAHWVDPKRVLTELGYRRVERIRKDELWSC